MNIFFGKISKELNPKQYQEGFYETDNTGMFNGIDVGDYCYIIAAGKIQLWKAREWKNGKKRLEFDIIIDNLSINTKDLTALKYFQLNRQFIVLTIRQSPNAFYKLTVVKSFPEKDLIDIKTYKNDNSYRKIIVRESLKDVQKEIDDIQLYYDNGELKIFNAPFFSADLFNDFTDNSDKIGMGQRNKDKTLSTIKNITSFPKIFGRQELTILNLYDAYGVKYNEKVEENLLNKQTETEDKDVAYWVFQANPTKVYRIIDALKAGLLRSWMVNQYKSSVKIGDKVILWVSGENAGVYALATVSSEVHSAIVDETEFKYFIDQTKKEENDRVNLHMDHNLIESPILKEEVLAHPILRELKQGTTGTNFPATQLQYDTILNIITKNPHMENSLNKILFGPPGTGKTYHTITEAIKIVDPELYQTHSDDREALQSRFNDLLIKDWKTATGQIAFCTFHQSFSYEDFVEGIKPRTNEGNNKQVYYEIEEGIFKKICRQAVATVNAQTLAKDNLIAFTQQGFDQAVFYKLSLGDSTKEEGRLIYDYCIKNNVISIGFGEEIDLTNMSEEDINNLANQNQLEPHAAQSLNYFRHYLKVGNYVVISNGNSYIRAIGKVTGEYRYEEENEIGWNHVRSVEWIFNNVDIPVTEFYQNSLMQKTIYKLKKDLIIPSFFVKAAKTEVVSNVSKKFCLIIDEINRGNVSSIFGELITLIEPTKRAGCPEALQVVLPYSKTPFSVPANVYIIGTMNTADRSIESLDTALRRRFSFTEMAPESELIKNKGESKGKIGNIDLVKMLDQMNLRIEKLIDKDHKIGHSYFITVSSLADLQLAFKDKVIPLLEEYFFGDFGKIGLVLGNSFVKKENNDFEFAKFEDYDSQTEQDLKQRAIYTIRPMTDWNFESIYE